MCVITIQTIAWATSTEEKAWISTIRIVSLTTVQFTLKVHEMI